MRARKINARAQREYDDMDRVDENLLVLLHSLSNIRVLSI